MFYRFVSALALLSACSVAFSQQTQPNDLELKLEQFPAQPVSETDNKLELDLNQFEQQQANEKLELNLDQFEQNKPTNRSVEEAEKKVLEVNIEQFEKDGNPPENEQSLDINSDNTNVNTEKPGLGKINNTGSAATKIGDTDTSEVSDDAYLLKAGLWLLAVVIPVFLFMRARIRRRRRSRAHNPTPRRPTYDERNHR